MAMHSSLADVDPWVNIVHVISASGICLDLVEYVYVVINLTLTDYNMTLRYAVMTMFCSIWLLFELRFILAEADPSKPYNPEARTPDFVTMFSQVCNHLARVTW